MTLEQKRETLKENIKSLGKVAVAFSSGVDSTLLLAVCKEVLGDNVVAITANSVSFPERERTEAFDFCKDNGIEQIEFSVNQLEIEGFKENPVDRCYICKKALFSSICEIAKENDCNYVLEGSNLDDDNDYRPGMRAIKELGVLSPLRDAQLTKAEIRQLSTQMNLPTAKKQSFACLATRFVYGDEITEEKLSMIDKAEQELLDLGFSQVRVRLHGKIARIEVAQNQMQRLLDIAPTITSHFKSYGFDYVTMDLSGYNLGSMNIFDN